MLNEFGGRERIIPAEVKGPIRNWRVVVHAVLLLFFVFLPWIQINNMQALLLDIPNRRFEIFGLLFLSHDAPLVFFLLILSALVLLFVTAVWGRVWCGWACPQTVFIDALYRRIEIWIEGNYIQRRKLASQPLSFNKAFKIGLKWISYLILSSLIAHSFMAYFAGAKPLIAMIQRPPAENWSYFLVASSVTALLMFNFGWFREQFCIIMCPYGRLQGALMDQRTVTVLYDDKRSDCVSCNRCVQVCPVKIDIREGIQMECISCTACIDACNEIMKKVHKPEGLIRHAAQSTMEPQFLRPRVLFYGFLILVFSTIFAVSIVSRKPYSLMIVRATDAPFQVLGSGQVLNHFKTHYINQSNEVQYVEFALPEGELSKGTSMTQANASYEVQPGKSVTPHLFISAPRSLFNEKGEMNFKIRMLNQKTGKFEEVEVRALGPYSAGS